MITIKRRVTSVKYPYDHFVNLIQNNSSVSASIPYRLIGYKNFIVSPTIKIFQSKVDVRMGKDTCSYLPDRNGNLLVEYYYEVHWFTLFLMIVSVLLVYGILFVPLILLIRSATISKRIKSVEKHAYQALSQIHPLEEKSTINFEVEKIKNATLLNNKTPPPLKNSSTLIEYFIAVDGIQKGPYDIEKIKMLLEFKNIDQNTLVWKEGMIDWASLSTFIELKE